MVQEVAVIDTDYVARDGDCASDKCGIDGGVGNILEQQGVFRRDKKHVLGRHTFKATMRPLPHLLANCKIGGFLRHCDRIRPNRLLSATLTQGSGVHTMVSSLPTNMDIQIRIFRA